MTANEIKAMMAKLDRMLDENDRLRAERDRLRDEYASYKRDVSAVDNERLRVVAERDRLREALQWFVDNDDTNEGDTPLPEHGGRTWNEINSYWIDGLNRARDLLKGGGDE